MMLGLHETMGNLISKAYLKLESFDPENSLLKYIRDVDGDSARFSFSGKHEEEFRKMYMPEKALKQEKSMLVLWNYFIEISKELFEYADT